MRRLSDRFGVDAHRAPIPVPTSHAGEIRASDREEATKGGRSSRARRTVDEQFDSVQRSVTTVRPTVKTLEPRRKRGRNCGDPDPAVGRKNDRREKREHGRGVRGESVAALLEMHWSVRVDEGTYDFWAFEKFVDRLACVCEGYGVSHEAESEARTSQTCPECSDREATIDHGDTLMCPCGFERHTGLAASETFLRENGDTEVSPMARPARFERDDHGWSADHTFTEVPKRCARARKLLPWVR